MVGIDDLFRENSSRYFPLKLNFQVEFFKLKNRSEFESESEFCFTERILILILNSNCKDITASCT